MQEVGRQEPGEPFMKSMTGSLEISCFRRVLRSTPCAFDAGAAAACAAALVPRALALILSLCTRRRTWQFCPALRVAVPVMLGVQCFVQLHALT
jgi:hypothetical protein